MANHPGTGAALIVLCAAMPEPRGGGDFDLEDNWHGPERTFPEHNISPGPMPDAYSTIAKRTIGRWAGNRVALVGDYAKESDLPAVDKASEIYGQCSDDASDPWLDISNDVAAVIEHELRGKYSGDGWRTWTPNEG